LFAFFHFSVGSPPRMALDAERAGTIAHGETEKRVECKSQRSRLVRFRRSATVIVRFRLVCSGTSLPGNLNRFLANNPSMDEGERIAMTRNCACQRVSNTVNVEDERQYETQ
jgi:hypothetical protein